MLFYENLDEIIFNRHMLFETDKLTILSGYVGPNPVNRLRELPLDVTVIYGMYGSDGIKRRLHDNLTAYDSTVNNINIMYSKIPVHAKCYAWHSQNNIVHALIGSANFSNNGLSTPYKEILAETTIDTFRALEGYINTILENSIACNDPNVAVVGLPTVSVTRDYDTEVCLMTLLDPRTGEVQSATGLNWGHANAHVNIDDANIPIRIDHIRHYPRLFPPKKGFATINIDGRPQRQNDAIDIIWDDGTEMTGLLEGSQPFNGLTYPKQVASAPQKNTLGLYMRNRLGLHSGEAVRRVHLDSYGRTDVGVSLQAEGIYYFDFSI